MNQPSDTRNAAPVAQTDATLADYFADTASTDTLPAFLAQYDTDTRDFAATYYALTHEHRAYVRAAVEAFTAIMHGEAVDLDAFRATVPLMEETAEVHATVEAHVARREGGQTA